MMLTLDDVIGDKINVHNFCKPIYKSEMDRSWIVREVVENNNTKFMLGSDSAPHYRDNKECKEGCAGIYSMSCLIGGIVQLFESNACLKENKINQFISRNARKFYRLNKAGYQIKLMKEDWKVPEIIYSEDMNAVIPFMANKWIDWKINTCIILNLN